MNYVLAAFPDSALKRNGIKNFERLVSTCNFGPAVLDRLQGFLNLIAYMLMKPGTVDNSRRLRGKLLPKVTIGPPRRCMLSFHNSSTEAHCNCALSEKDTETSCICIRPAEGAGWY